MNSLNQALDQSSYARQLRSPEWHAFSARIKENRKACEICRRTDVILQVHHYFYDMDKMLWEYAGEDVIVLCRACHQAMHDELKKFRKYVFSRLNPQSFKVVNGALAVAFEQYDPLVFSHALAEFVSNPHLIQNYANAWGVTALKPG